MPEAEARRRAVRVALRLGVVMLTSGAQAQEVESSLRVVLQGLGLAGGEAAVTYSTVMVSYVAPGDAEATTAIRVVRRWQPDYNRLAAAARLVQDIGLGRAALTEAEGALDDLTASGPPYPRWLSWAAPALLSMAVTIMFGGSLGDAAATLGIGLAIQPALERIERSELSYFFQIAFGVSATTLLVVLLVKAGLPISGGLVLTGSLLRFLPGAALVSGMHDFIAGALMSGTARLVEVVLLGAAIAGAAALMLSFGASIDVQLAITSEGWVDWPAPVLVAAGMVAVACYGCRLGVPRGPLLGAGLLGGVAVVVGHGLTVLSSGLRPNARTLVAALIIGMIGQLLANRSQAPAALWMVPAILPLLPAPATLLPGLASASPAEGTALQTAFCIGVGVASGAIIIESYLRYRARLLQPVVATVSGGIAAHIGGPVKRWAGQRRRTATH